MRQPQIYHQKYEGREIRHDFGYRSVWTAIRCSPWSLVSQPLEEQFIYQLRQFKIFLISWMVENPVKRSYITEPIHTWRAHRYYIVIGKFVRMSLPSVDNGSFWARNPFDMEINKLMWLTHSPPLGWSLVIMFTAFSILLLDMEEDIYTTVGRSTCIWKVQHKRKS